MPWSPLRQRRRTLEMWRKNARRNSAQVAMNRLGVIRRVGDVITDIDVLRASLLPDDPLRQKMNDYRILLDDPQQQLTRKLFDDNTPAFVAAATRLKKIDSQIEASIDKLDNMEATLKNIKTFIDSVTNLLSAVAIFA